MLCPQVTRGCASSSLPEFLRATYQTKEGQDPVSTEPSTGPSWFACLNDLCDAHSSRRPRVQRSESSAALHQYPSQSLRRGAGVDMLGARARIITSDPYRVIVY